LCTTAGTDHEETASVPAAEKLVMPPGYGATTRTLAWESVRARLEEAKQYWVAINRPGGSPHVVPVDGLWVDDTLYYGGGPDTLHVRAALADPHVTIHLPDPWKVVVVQGEARVTRPSPELAQRLADLANAKYPEYGMTFDASSYAEPFGLRPRRAIAWSSFPADATRFTF
jgi:nitroimidazol reductase NimA-like FMN-containing flavoprotein (pyridoxamine 5'-phosphate oxidase superfamily)